MGKLRTADGTNGTGGYEWEYAKKLDTRTTAQKILNFIYNPQTHAVLGRTAKSWGGLLLFCAIFYSVLALLFAICMKVLLATLTKESPKWQLEESLIGTNPGLGFRPMATDAEAGSIVWYNRTTKQQWIDTMTDLVKTRYTTNVTHVVNCTYGQTNLPGDVCRVHMDSFEKCGPSYDFGFGIGTPCIFIKLNRIYGWVPEFYNDLKFLDEVADNARDAINATINKNQSNHVWLSCNGQSAHDRENQGLLEYLPAPGFPHYYYPYMNIDSYMSPMVAVRFLNATPGVLINMECRAWAKNIHYQSNSQVREGSVHFELQVDDFPNSKTR